MFELFKTHKIFVSRGPDEGPISRIYKELLPLNDKKTTQLKTESKNPRIVHSTIYINLFLSVFMFICITVSEDWSWDTFLI